MTPRHRYRVHRATITIRFDVHCSGRSQECPFRDVSGTRAASANTTLADHIHHPHPLLSTYSIPRTVGNSADWQPRRECFKIPEKYPPTVNPRHNLHIDGVPGLSSCLRIPSAPLSFPTRFP